MEYYSNILGNIKDKSDKEIITILYEHIKKQSTISIQMKKLQIPSLEDILEDTKTGSNIEISEKIIKYHNRIYKKCTDTKCHKTKHISHFINEYGKELLTCDDCRNKGIIKAKKLKSIMRKKKWRYVNHEKMAEYSKQCRGRKILEIGPDAFKRLCAYYMKQWRDNNPEAAKNNQEKRKVSNNIILNIYKRDAKLDGKKWELDNEYAISLINSDCFYCGKKITEENKNGIDRFDSYKDYTYDNSVSACKLCNYMKICMDPLSFITKVSNISIYTNDLDEEIDYSVSIINRNKLAKYSNYIRCAKDRKIEFNLTEKEFNDLIFGDCYLCGIEKSNGIDRVDSNNIYIINNCEPCCTDCNIIKNDIKYDIFIDQCDSIYNHWKDSDIVIEWCDNITQYDNIKNLEEYIKNTKYICVKKEHRSIVKSSRTKMSKEQKQEETLKRKKLSNKNLLNKYCKELIDNDHDYEKESVPIDKLAKTKTTEIPIIEENDHEMAAIYNELGFLCICKND